MDVQPDRLTMEPACRLALEASFGSAGHWREDFVARAAAPDAATGWLMLLFLPGEGRLVNQRVADPARVDGVPILALDLQRQRDPQAFLTAVDWTAAYTRYREAARAASEAFAVDADGIGGRTLLDVRRAGVFEKAATTLPGARWRDPAQVLHWAAELPRGAEAVVYCVYGHEVSQATVLRLRAAGIDARFLRGGIEGWQAEGRPLAPKAGG